VKFEENFMKRCSFCSVLSFGIFFAVAAIAHGEDQPSNTPKANAPAVESGARFMLRNPQSSASIERQPTAADFSWSALTKNGPASGSDPVIGEKSGKARYDFKDGLPHPYYLSPAKNS